MVVSRLVVVCGGRAAVHDGRDEGRNGSAALERERRRLRKSISIHEVVGALQSSRWWRGGLVAR